VSDEKFIHSFIFSKKMKVVIFGKMFSKSIIFCEINVDQTSIFSSEKDR